MQMHGGGVLASHSSRGFGKLKKAATIAAKKRKKSQNKKFFFCFRAFPGSFPLCVLASLRLCVEIEFNAKAQRREDAEVKMNQKNVIFAFFRGISDWRLSSHHRLLHIAATE